MSSADQYQEVVWFFRSMRSEGEKVFSSRYMYIEFSSLRSKPAM